MYTYTILAIHVLNVRTFYMLLSSIFTLSLTFVYFPLAFPSFLDQFVPEWSWPCCQAKIVPWFTKELQEMKKTTHWLLRLTMDENSRSLLGDRNGSSESTIWFHHLLPQSCLAEPFWVVCELLHLAPSAKEMKCSIEHRNELAKHFADKIVCTMNWILNQLSQLLQSL